LLAKAGELAPRETAVKLRFDLWLEEQRQTGNRFTEVQVRWLQLLRDHIVTSLSFDPEPDYDLSPFFEQGGISRAYQLFGDRLDHIIAALNEELIKV
jgi:type I restriction enzyme, R subunit